MLQPLVLPHNDPRLLVGLNGADDAAVYRLLPDQAIIQTVDFFPPIVDDPFQYGQIAAANALSDIFAMGGEVLFALNIAAFPDTLPLFIITQIFAGGQSVVQQAGGIIVGGHTVTDREPKYGLCVTGVVDPTVVLRKSGAKPGDVLVLTKPLGTGAITTALRSQEARAQDVAAAVRSMTDLNLAASRAAVKVRAHACTDITGFGLIGHASEMALAGEVAFHIRLSQLPLLPGAYEVAQRGCLPDGLYRNREYFAKRVTSIGTLDPVLEVLAFDPETSGGLLIALSPTQLERFREAIGGQPVWEIASVHEGSGLVLEP